MDDKIIENIRIRRKELGITQGEMAQQLNMSRPTYIAIEKGDRDLTLTELREISGILGMKIDMSPYARELRNDQKFEQMLLYFVQKYPEGVPKTKLAKLLYLADFSNFYLCGRPMSGVQYVCREYGPVADVFFRLLDELDDCHVLNIEKVKQALMIAPMGEVIGETLLDADDKKLMDKIDSYWHNKKTQEIVNFTHEQRPWQTRLNGEDIPYFTIVLEDPDHVYAPVDIYG